MVPKKDIVERLALNAGVGEAIAGAVYGSLFKSILEEVLESGDRVHVPGFGIFEIRQRAARRGRNPATGEAINIPSQRYLHFKQSATLRKKLNEDV